MKESISPVGGFPEGLRVPQIQSPVGIGSRVQAVPRLASWEASIVEARVSNGKSSWKDRRPSQELNLHYVPLNPKEKDFLHCTQALQIARMTAFHR